VKIFLSRSPTPILAPPLAPAQKQRGLGAARKNNVVAGLYNGEPREREPAPLPFTARTNRPASKLNRLQAILGKNAAGSLSGEPGLASRNREFQPRKNKVIPDKVRP
jgi:hypothetical protein